MRSSAVRAVVVHRATDYARLLATHATRGQAEFFLRSRGQDINTLEAEDRVIQLALATVHGAIPARWRRATVERAELSRFLFEPDDLVLAVGQDGLVANLAKYLAGQLVIGINPLPARFDGVLVRHSPDGAAPLFARIDAARDIAFEQRTMVEALLDDGQRLLALNEVFIGHRSHQSARYQLSWDNRKERHSSSGVIACSGTGASGWARSVNFGRATPLALPAPTDPSLAFFVREAWPSKATGTTLTAGMCDSDRSLDIVSEMNDGGVIFGDGIEEDFLRFDWGRKVIVRVAAESLRLAAQAP